MKKVFFFLLLTSLTIIMTNCNKSEENNKHYLGTAYIDNRIKSLVFNIGSYWIYTSDTLNQMDSTFISGIKSGFYEIGYGQDNYQKYEYYAMHFKSNYNLGKNSFGQFFIDRTHLLIDPVVVYPWAVGPVLYSVDTIKESVKYLDSLNGKYYKFYHVQECSFNSRYYWGDTAYTYYTEPNIGIVKKIITIDSFTTIWSLKRWKIVK
jgi:hypothetical protein